MTTGAGQYSTSIPLRSPADDWAAKTTFQRWIWYAARRAELHLDEAWDDFNTPARLSHALQVVTPTLRLTAEDREQLRSEVRVVRYGAEEIIQFPGEVPTRMLFVVHGRVSLTAVGDDGEVLTVRTLTEGDFLGQTTLTREPVIAGAHALDEVTVLQIDRTPLEQLMTRKPALLHDLGHAIDERRSSVRRTIASAAD